MKKVLQAAGVAGLVFLSAAGCSSTCCSRSTTANACPPGTPGTPITTTTTNMTPTVVPSTPIPTSGKPLSHSAPATGITAPTNSTVVLPPK